MVPSSIRPSIRPRSIGRPPIGPGLVTRVARNDEGMPVGDHTETRLCVRLVVG